MGVFIIDPRGNRHNVADGIHIDYFEEHLEGALTDRQRKRFLKILHIDPDPENVQNQFRAVLRELIDNSDYQKFYSGASEIGYLCGSFDQVNLHLRMTGFDCINDYHIKPLLDILVKKHIKKIWVDFVHPDSDYVTSESYSQNRFLEKL